MRIFIFYCLVVFPSLVVHSYADPIDEIGAFTDNDRVDRISGSEAVAEDWEWVARKIVDKGLRSEIRNAILARETYPKKELVALLTNEHLAIRLGALELLEEAAGDNYGFNAWVSPSGKGADPANAHALQLWNTWAGNGEKVLTIGPVLSDGQMQAYIRDIISGNSDRKKRAVRMLDPHGMKGVTEIQEFLVRNRALPPNSKISLKAAQYHLVLSKTTGENASVLARDLTLGNRDQKLGAISGLKKSGFLAIPIVRDFLGSDDPLIRETAVDTILTLGGAQTVHLVKPYLEEEKDVNVIHAAMRRFREIGGNEVTAIIAGYLDYEDEDLIVSAVQSLTKLTKGGSPFSSSSGGGVTLKGEWESKVIKLLGDPRWRVRSTCLEFVAARRTKAAGDKVVDLLSDEDEFVRSKAIEATVALRLSKASEKLEGMFLSDDEMVAPVAKALTGMNIVLSGKLIGHLDSRESDVIIRAIRSLDLDKEAWLKIVARYATHKDLDVSCAALRSLANDDDKLKFDFVANHLTSALQSGMEAKVQAVVDTLQLPTASSGADPALIQALLGDTKSAEATALDPLYEAFLKPLSNQKEKDAQIAAANQLTPSVSASATGGLSSLKGELAKFSSDWGKPKLAFRASLLLAKAGDGRGIQMLAKRVNTLSTSERAAIANGLYYPRTAAALPLIAALMQDDVPDIRVDAAGRAFSEPANGGLIQMGLNQLEVSDTKIHPVEMYGYGAERVAKDSKSQRLVRNWALKTLSTEDSEDAHKIFALILMQTAMSYSDIDVMASFTRSPDQWIRRAAWYSLSKARSSWLSKNVERLVNDTSPRVREVLPAALTTVRESWLHYFSDSQFKPHRSYSYSSSSRRASLSESNEKALRKLAQNDPSSLVRFESWFCLLSYGKSIDLKTFIQLLSEQPKEAKVAGRLANYIEQNYRSMGQGMKPLLAFINLKEISRNKLPLVLEHFNRGDRDSFTSFKALAKVTEASNRPQHIASNDDPEEMMKKRQRLLVVMFHKSGCKECDKVEKYLSDMQSEFPLMEIQKRNIENQTDILVNQALCSRFQSTGFGKTPALFTQAGAAIAPNTKPEMIVELLQNTMELPDDPEWSMIDTEEIDEAKRQVEETFANLTLPIIVGAGLLDGINPCAFATIIFFLSYLQVAKRKPKEILMVGGAFILAIFLSYFAVGLIFHSLVAKLTELDGFHWIRSVMTYVFAAFALVVAYLSLRDALRARRGNLKDMTLQLPTFLKNRIRGVIRKGAKARNFVLAAFVSGVLISLLELACTGQVYAPIIFQIQQGSVDAVFYLLIYNLAFVFPLVIIFVMAYRGMTSETLIKFQQKHTASVKFATAILFVILAVVILFGEQILPH